MKVYLYYDASHVHSYDENGIDHDLLAVDKIHVDLNWRYLNEYLDQISANDEVLFLKQGHEIIAKNQLAREKLIIYNSEGNYNIIDSVDTEYIEKTSVVPNNALFEIYFYYPGGNLLNASDKLFYLPFAFIIIVLLVVYLMTTRVFRRQFSEMTELVNTLAFLPDSTDRSTLRLKKRGYWSKARRACRSTAKRSISRPNAA